MQPKSSNLWSNLLLAVSLILLGYGIRRLFAIDVMSAPWVAIITAAGFVAGLLCCAVLVKFRRKPDVAILAATLIFSFAVGSYVLQLTGRDIIDIIDAKLVRRLEAAGLATGNTPAPVAGSYADWQSPRPPDSRTQDEVRDALKRHGFTFVARFHPPLLLELIETKLLPPPLSLGASSKSFGSIILGCNEGDQRDFPIWHSDRYGFNNDDTVYAFKELYMLVGGSFATGSCVHQDENMQGVLRRNGFPTFTTGWGGAGAIAALATLKEYGETYRPKAVLWQYYDPNDVALLRQRELHSSFLLQYLRDGFTQDLIHRQAELDAMWKGGAWSAAEQEFKRDPQLQAIWEKKLETNLPMVQQLLGRDIGSLTEDDDLLRIYERIFAIAKRRVAAWGGKIYLVMIPNEEIYLSGTIPKFQRRIESMMARLGIATIDVDQVFRAVGGDPRRFFADPNSSTHFNPAGYRLTSEQIMNVLARDFPVAKPISDAATSSH